MAITDAGQICESTSLASTITMTLSGSVKAGALMCLGISGRRDGGYYVDITGVSDSQGGSWNVVYARSSYRMAAVCWAQAGVAMQSGTDWIRVTLDAVPQEVWITGHNFEGASAVATDSGYTLAPTSSTVASHTVAVAGSDFLVLTHMTHAGSSTTTTPLNSMTEQDSYSGTYFHAEFMSRNYTSGSTFQGGTTLGAARQWGVVSVSFPYQAMPAAGSRGQSFLVGI